jgi:hypothetical protein
MERVLTTENLQTASLKMLESFNDEGVTLSPETLHKEVLSNTDSKVYPSAKQYPDLVRWVLSRGLQKEGKSKKDADKIVSKIKFMPGWLNQSVATVVSDLIGKLPALLLLMFLSFTAQSQLQFNVGLAQTDLKKAAVSVGLYYVRSLDSTFANQDIFKTGNKSLFQLSPEFSIQGGTEDAFSSVQAKLTGSIMTFSTTTAGNLEIPDLSKMYNIFPITVGVETNGDFRVFNGILEIGYVPVYWTANQMVPAWLKRTRASVFIQAGYKFNRDTVAQMGGDIDMSEESERKSILRVKGSFEANIINPVTVGQFRFGLVGSADGWYDAANGAAYYKIDGDLRVYLSGDNYVSFIYQKGSGAPLFNPGSQFGVGLNVTF